MTDRLTQEEIDVVYGRHSHQCPCCTRTWKCHEPCRLPIRSKCLECWVDPPISAGFGLVGWLAAALTVVAVGAWIGHWLYITL